MILPLILLAAQVPVPLGTPAKITWDAQNCGPIACGYYVSRLTVSTGTTKCPGANGNYTPLNYGNPAMTNVFIDGTAAKKKVCFVVQTVAGSTVTEPSAPVGPFAVPQ